MPITQHLEDRSVKTRRHTLTYFFGVFGHVVPFNTSRNHNSIPDSLLLPQHNVLQGFSPRSQPIT